MRVGLVIPPSLFLLDEKVFVSLGILKVAAALEAVGHDVEVLDLSGVENYEDVARAWASQTRAAFIGLTATTPQMPATTKVIRAMRPETGAVFVLGGPHATLVNAAWKRERTIGRATRARATLIDMVDVLVAGDGEDAMCRLVQNPDRSVFDADDPAGPLFLTNRRLTELPPPARHLVDLESYRYSIDGVPATSLIAQLGCPFGCGFCGGRESPMLRRVRARPTASILNEIEHLHAAHGYSGFMFYDDELNVSKSFVELMEGIRDLANSHGAAFKLRGFIKAELFTDEQAKAMREAGFSWILTGFESGSPRVLENINKRATLEDNYRCIAIAREAGLKVKALMSLGHPGESRGTIQETKEWLLRARPDDFDATIITTYPGSPYYDRAVETSPGVWTYTCEKSGDRLHAQEVDYNEVADYYKGAPGEYRSYVWTDHVSREDLVRMRDQLEADARGDLGLPFNPAGSARKYEQSMGQLPVRSSGLARSSHAV